MAAIKNQILLFLIILIEGFVSVAVEILTIRQLIPFAGSNVVVTSLIIGIFLLFLAIGYWRGGKISDDYYLALKKNLTWASVFLGIGLSYIFILFFFHFFYLSGTQNILLILTIYLCVIIAPMVYFLGQTIPLTMNLVKQEYNLIIVGEIGGKVLFISTIGSFFGSILTTILLVEFFGVAITVFINFALLIFLIMTLSFNKEKWLGTYFFLLVLTSVVYLINVFFERNYFIKTTNYANYNLEYNITIPSGKTGNILHINNSSSSFLDNYKRGFPYIEEIKKILFTDLKMRNKNILVIGSGGFTLSATGAHDNNFDYLDIDAKIKKIVKDNFLPNIIGNFIPEDARTYLSKKNKIYDVIVSDVYSNANTIPPELLTMEYFASLRNNLTKNGIAIFNIIINPTLDDPYSKHVDSTIRAIFKNCMVIPHSIRKSIKMSFMYVKNLR